MNEPLDIAAIELAMAELNVDLGLMVGGGSGFVGERKKVLSRHVDEMRGSVAALIAEVKRLREALREMQTEW